MAYPISNTAGTQIANVLDGQVDTTHTSIRLIGRLVTNYGDFQNENLVWLLENFSNSTDPAHPLEGQLWWNNSSKVMNVYNGSTWKPLTGFSVTSSAPTAVIGDQWWDTTNDQYKIYTGSEWVVIGPAYSKLDSKTGMFVENVYDTSTTKHSVVKVYTSGAVTAMVSGDAEFEPNVAISGFGNVKPGISFTSNLASLKFQGTATDADKLGGVAATNYLRSDSDDVTTGRLSVQNQFDVGSSNELNFSVSTGTAVIKNTYNNGGILLKVNLGGISTTALSVDGSSGLVTVAASPQGTLGVVTKGYADGIVSTLRSDVSTYISGNVSTVNTSISATNANVTAANAAIAALDSAKAPKASPALTGVPTAPTALPGTANTQIATTAFVAAEISQFDATMIYNGTSSAKVNSANIQLTAGGTLVATVTNGGITTTTQSATDNSTKVATTAFVNRAVKNFVLNSTSYQPTCYVSSSAPDNGVGQDGDFWFQYT
jgi:hypothetical protein